MAKKRSEVTLALAQIAAAQGDKKANQAKIEKYINQAADQGADIVVFPEMANTGYFITREQVQELAEKQDGAFISFLRKKARDRKIHIMCGYTEAGAIKGKTYNSCIFIDDRGRIIENMRKVYVWAEEKLKFDEGTRFPVVDTKFGRIGMLICADLEYPEPSRILMLKGADMIVDVSVWSIPAERRWHVDLAANALFNLLFTVGCNPVENNCCGSSMIVGPDGEVRAMASRTEEELLIHTVDLDEVAKTRARIPYINDFKDETFPNSIVEQF